MKRFFEHVSWQTVFAAFMAIFFLRNALMPLIAADYSYAFIWDGDARGNLINGLNPNHFQRVESFGDLPFDVANTFVFAAFVLLLFKVGTGLPLRAMNKTYLLFILTGIYFCTPSLIITTIWLTGACNYLWMSALIILFLLPFALKYRRADFWRTPPAWSVPQSEPRCCSCRREIFTAWS